jgi:hypothetical protein
VKYAWVETHCDLFSATRMSRVLGVSRTGYCQLRVSAPSERAIANATLDAQVAAIHAATKGQLRSAAHRAGSACERQSGRSRPGTQELAATGFAAGL